MEPRARRLRGWRWCLRSRVPWRPPESRAPFALAAWAAAYRVVWQDAAGKKSAVAAVLEVLQINKSLRVFLLIHGPSEALNDLI